MSTISYRFTISIRTICRSGHDKLLWSESNTSIMNHSCISSKLNQIKISCSPHTLVWLQLINTINQIYKYLDRFLFNDISDDDFSPLSCSSVNHSLCGRTHTLRKEEKTDWTGRRPWQIMKAKLRWWTINILNEQTNKHHKTCQFSPRFVMEMYCFDTPQQVGGRLGRRDHSRHCTIKKSIQLDTKKLYPVLKGTRKNHKCMYTIVQ